MTLLSDPSRQFATTGRAGRATTGTTQPTVLVLGGSGFIGRHAVEALRNRRCDVVIGSRHPLEIDAFLPDNAQRCPRRTVRFEELGSAEDWAALLSGIDVVINCVGILRQRRRETYDLIHHRAPAALAAACRLAQARLIHVSALGLRPDARSRFLRSKLAGERALKESGADWSIVRPSLLDGDRGYGAEWLRFVARLPIHPLPADATGKIAALDVRDLGEALATIAMQPRVADRDAEFREFELGGHDLRTLGEHVAAIRRLETPRKAWLVRVPSLIARAGSHLCDLLHWSPFSFGHWELLRRDNCPAHNRLPELLGRAPRLVGARDEAKIRSAASSTHPGNAETPAAQSQW
jgi:NADH dehydrogenase